VNTPASPHQQDDASKARGRLHFEARPTMTDARMVLGFTGWMDGGEVSTGTVERLRQKLGARPLAHIAARDFYILSFPGSMETSALFRPHCKIEGGRIAAFAYPANAFHYSEAHRLVLFSGKEPNLLWEEYAACIFTVAAAMGVTRMYFIGSVAGLVPHTREPRLSCSASDAALAAEVQRYGARPSNYEGPASISTLLTALAPDRGLEMVNLVAEIPAYVQGRNHRCIEAVTRHLAGILNLQIDLDDLRRLADRLEEKLNEAIDQRPELAERIRGLEADYDSEIFDTQMGDLRDWLEQQGIRLD
jgi:predicted ATP-grasp superfamily ATP-dependent carboligase